MSILAIMEFVEIQNKILPILKKHRVTKAGLFGSVVKQRMDDSSDVDILVELGDAISLLDFIGIKLELEDALGKKVDLVEYQTLKPRLKDEILSSEYRIYG